jgi:hypothetical protein
MTASRAGGTAATSFALCLVVGCAGPAAEEREPARPLPAAVAEAPARVVLRSWDRRRAAAYAAGSPLRLRALYAGRAGDSDVRLLEGYRSRGWRVAAMRMQVLALAVTAHGQDRWRVRVTDRLAGAVAVRGSRRVLLPRDRASTRTVTLVRGVDGVWRVAAVRPG